MLKSLIEQIEKCEDHIPSKPFEWIMPEIDYKDYFATCEVCKTTYRINKKLYYELKEVYK